MIAASTRITLSADPDLTVVEAAWRDLESAAMPSLFQSWTWVGCLADERFPAPVLLRAERDGRTVGLALLNRTQGRLGAERLWLNESGDPALDSSARVAVMKASPLPVPSNSDDFEPFRQFILKVKPENVVST